MMETMDEGRVAAMSLEEFEASYVLTEEDLIEIAEIRRDLIERGELKAFDDDEESSYESSSSSSSGDGSESSGSLDTIDRDRIDRSRRYLMLTRLDEKAYRADRYGEPKGFVDAHRLFDYELKVDTMRSRQSRAYQLLESGEPLLTYPVANASPKHPLAVGRAVEILDTARLARNRDYEFDDYEEDDMQTFDYYFDLELEMDGVRQCETDLALELRRQLDEKARADEERLARKEVRKKNLEAVLVGCSPEKNVPYDHAAVLVDHEKTQIAPEDHVHNHGDVQLDDAVFDAIINGTRHLPLSDVTLTSIPDDNHFFAPSSEHRGVIKEEEEEEEAETTAVPMLIDDA